MPVHTLVSLALFSADIASAALLVRTARRALSKRGEDETGRERDREPHPGAVRLAA